MTISPTGLISGLILPNVPASGLPNYDMTPYDQYPFDFTAQSFNTNYEFVLEVSDGKISGSSLRTFSIFVWSRSIMSADTTQVTADDTFVTADTVNYYIPVIMNPQGSIGTVRNNNWFAYRFNAIDLDSDQTQFAVVSSTPGPLSTLGLELDINTGWLYGYIPDLGITELSYTFEIVAYKKDDYYNRSVPYEYSLNVIGSVDTDIIWLTDSNLGTIDNGSVSTLYVQAVNVGGIELQYQLANGSNSSLPQGLQLLPSGDIAGRVSFDTFALDLGTTTFDVTFNDLGISGENTETTFDMSHTFVVNAYSVNGLVNVFKSFTITVNRAYNTPYENLYIQAMPPQSDRDFIDSLLQNQDIFVPDLLYRPADPNFGLSTSVVYNHAFGLTASTVDEYYSSLYENHYWKNLTLGEIRVAQATDTKGNVIYEVVYSAVIDNLLNAQGQSVSKEVTLPYPINEGDSTEVDVVYPNSLINMRDQVIDTVGTVGTILPQWMISKQADGRVLGFTPAWVLAYVKPGRGDQIAYYIRTKFGERLNLIDFEVDRYELDRLLTKNWDPIADSTGGAWEPTPAETSFDLVTHYQISNLGISGGTGYAVGDQILILGSQLGGVDGANNMTIIIEQVNSNGTVQQFRGTGFATLLSTGDIYTDVSGTNITGTGSGARWDIVVVGADPTTFDGSSVRFIAPVDMYSNTQEYDKYLVFPKRTILG
jgi:hypothetical protein